jgi:hypothetical protein
MKNKDEGFEVRDKRKSHEAAGCGQNEDEDSGCGCSCGSSHGADKGGGFHMPEANFTNFILGLSSNAMINLGMMEDPTGTFGGVNLEIAKHIIDTIAMLADKSKGNLNDDEKQLTQQTLYHLRMAFVSAMDKRGG